MRYKDELSDTLAKRDLKMGPQTLAIHLISIKSSGNARR